jgi:NAD(P)-dependent dehydrogenase (short-subunit alcohol dehydrogenase family)
LRIKNKIAVVTGGGSGLGKAISERFAAEGAFVIIADISATAGAEAAAELVAQGARAASFELDVSNQQQVHDFFKLIIDQFGSIDILVNNAGIARHEPFIESKGETWSAVLGVDLQGVFYCAQAVAPHMVSRRSGKIVNISSLSGAGASSMAGGSPAGNAAYASAKAGVIQLTKTLARELSPSGINVNCVAPGLFMTPFAAKGRTPQQLEELMAARSVMAAMGRPGQVEELASVVLFFVSDDSSFVTGQTLCVDGGRGDRM